MLEASLCEQLPGKAASPLGSLGAPVHTSPSSCCHSYRQCAGVGEGFRPDLPSPLSEVQQRTAQGTQGRQEVYTNHIPRHEEVSSTVWTCSPEREQLGVGRNGNPTLLFISNTPWEQGARPSWNVQCGPLSSRPWESCSRRLHG